MHTSTDCVDEEDISPQLDPDTCTFPAAQTTPSMTNDPLLEQMSSLLSSQTSMLWPSQPSLPITAQPRRRFSDADRVVPEPAASPSNRTSGATSVLSRDGVTWRPAPDDRPCMKDSAAVAAEPQTSTLEPHICQAYRCAALKVFATTELLENILAFFQTKNVLSLQRTSRLFQSVVDRSPRLRLHHFIYGQWYRPGSDFQLLPFNNLPGLTIRKDKALDLGQWISVSMTLEAARHISPHSWPHKTRVRSRSIFEGLRGSLGPRAKAEAAGKNWASSGAVEEEAILPMDALLISQPPLPNMQAYLVSTTTSTNEAAVDHEARACCKLFLSTGITLGYLARTAQQLLDQTEGSSSTARPSSVVFKGIMSFCDPDKMPRRRERGEITTPINFSEGGVDAPSGEASVVQRLP